MDIREDIYLNQLGQGIKPLTEGEVWFAGLTTEVQREVLRRLVFFILQAGGTSEDVEGAVKSTGLKRTFTPCQVLLKASQEEPHGNRRLSDALSRVVNLPAGEGHKSFKLLVALFTIADQRKRKKGLQPEKYWWHLDLSNEKVVETIVNDYEKPGS